MRINGVDQTAGLNMVSVQLPLRVTWRAARKSRVAGAAEWRLLADDVDAAPKTLAYGVSRCPSDWTECGALKRDRWQSLQQEIDDFDDDNPDALATAIVGELLAGESAVSVPRGARKAFEKGLVEWICDRRAAAFTASVA